MGILGLGSIGRAVAQRAGGFGTRVLGCNRTLREVAHVDRQYPLERIDEFLAECDFVVIAAALAPQTEGLIDARRLAQMKPSAVLINVGRGPIVEEDALYAALKEKRIRGATLDVWNAYPSKDNLTLAPSKHPFPRARTTSGEPHTAAWTTGMVDRRWREIAENLDRLGAASRCAISSGELERWSLHLYPCRTRARGGGRTRARMAACSRCSSSRPTAAAELPRAP